MSQATTLNQADQFRQTTFNDKIVLTLRILFGLGLIVFGLNKFLGFMPQPVPPADGGQFLGALAMSGYIFPIAGVVYLLTGVALLTNKFAPLMTVVVFPILLNAFLYHARFDPAGIAGAAVFLTLNVLVLIAYKPAYDPLLRP